MEKQVDIALFPHAWRAIFVNSDDLDLVNVSHNLIIHHEWLVHLNEDLYLALVIKNVPFMRGSVEIHHAESFALI